MAKDIKHKKFVIRKVPQDIFDGYDHAKALSKKNLQEEIIRVKLGDGTSLVIWVSALAEVTRFRDIDLAPKPPALLPAPIKEEEKADQNKKASDTGESETIKVDDGKDNKDKPK